jgi:hypothetical protein
MDKMKTTVKIQSTILAVLLGVLFVGFGYQAPRAVATESKRTLTHETRDKGESFGAYRRAVVRKVSVHSSGSTQT